MKKLLTYLLIGLVTLLSTLGVLEIRDLIKENEDPFKYESNLDETDEVDEPDYTVVYWDEMDRLSNGDYVYVFHGHKYQYSKRYVDMEMDKGIVGQEYEVK